MIMSQKTRNSVQTKIINKWSGKWSEKLSGKCSPDFEGEFIEMFPMDCLATFDTFWVVLRHFFLDVSEKMFD